MEPILAEILNLAAGMLKSGSLVNTGLAIAKDAIAAYEAKNQAGLDAAHDAATALANSLAPAVS